MSSSYASWLAKRATAIFIASAVAIAAAGYLVAFHLPVRAAFSNLLPSDAPSVKAFDALAERLPARDTMLIVLVAPDPATRQAAAADALAAARAIPADLVDHLEGDDGNTRGTQLQQDHGQSLRERRHHAEVQVGQASADVGSKAREHETVRKPETLNLRC